MKTKLKLASVVLLMALCFIPVACRKDNQTGRMNISMTDAPANYAQVNVEVIGVEVHHESAGWVSLPCNQGVYNLLDLQNNVTVVLASNAQIPIGHVTQMRLILGSNNSIVDSLGSYPLKVPSGSESGLKMNINEVIRANHTISILLDFDAYASIVVEGVGRYSLKPVIKIKAVTQS